jgi:hypothetical protein
MRPGSFNFRIWARAPPVWLERVARFGPVLGLLFEKLAKIKVLDASFHKGFYNVGVLRQQSRVSQ